MVITDIVEYREGHLYWKIKQRGYEIGDKVGTLSSEDNYLKFNYETIKYRVHLVIYEIHFGPIPPGFEVDHKDTDRTNNWPGNLRLATHQQNSFNRAGNKVATSKYKGVSWINGKQKWRAQIKHNGKNKYIGDFKEEIAAYNAYCKVAKELHGDFVNLG